jgi:dCMP deaminase
MSELPVVPTARPSFDEIFMETCHLVARRTTCPRRGVGAVIAKDKHVLTTGYNGAPKGFPHPTETGCIRDRLDIPSGELADVCPCLHAEQNAILQAALFGVSVKDSTLYCTTQPCTQCARMIVNAGIREVVFEIEYRDPLSIGLLTTGGVTLSLWDSQSKSRRPYPKTNTWEEAQAAFAKDYLAKKGVGKRA